jgi:hypothetical protein
MVAVAYLISSGAYVLTISEPCKLLTLKLH